MTLLMLMVLAVAWLFAATGLVIFREMRRAERHEFEARMRCLRESRLERKYGKRLDLRRAA